MMHLFNKQKQKLIVYEHKNSLVCDDDNSWKINLNRNKLKVCWNNW